MKNIELNHKDIYDMIKAAGAKYAIVFDTETTGLDEGARILQIAWTQFDPGDTPETNHTHAHSVYFDYPGPVIKNPTESINRINTQEVRDAAEGDGKYHTGEVWSVDEFPMQWLEDWLNGDCLLIGQNILGFDVRLCRQTLQHLVANNAVNIDCPRANTLIDRLRIWENGFDFMNDLGQGVVDHCKFYGGRPSVDDIQGLAMLNIEPKTKQFDTMFVFNELVNMDAITKGTHAINKINNLDATKYMMNTEWALNDDDSKKAIEEATKGLHDAANDIVVTEALAEMVYRATGYNDNLTEQVITHKLKRMM